MRLRHPLGVQSGAQIIFEVCSVAPNARNGTYETNQRGQLWSGSGPLPDIRLAADHFGV